MNNDKKRIILLTDFRGAFYSSTTNNKTLCSVNIEKLVDYIKNCNIIVDIYSFSKINLNDSYEGVYIWYTSSEDIGLRYKCFIEDVVLALKEKGAILIPDYKYLHAHHNKCFMEALRSLLIPEQAQFFNTRIFGTYEELQAAIANEGWEQKKYIIKTSFGAGSNGVFCAACNDDLLKIAKKISNSGNFNEIIREYRRRLFWKGYIRNSLNRNKFIVQNFIDLLNGDFKVLKYGMRFYPLYRKNRDHDFRASGSGRLSFDIPESVDITRLLDFAFNMSIKISTPLCSMDIGYDGQNFYLLEFQCVCFGPYAAEKSSGYYTMVNGTWIRYDEVCDLEKIMCEAIAGYIETGKI